MSARIAPDSIASVAAVYTEYRPVVATPEVVPVEAASAPKERPPFADMGKISAEVSGAISGTVEASSPDPIPPAPLPVEPPGSAYVRAVISGALSPRPTSAQELFTRVGTGWVPPESEYRLADKTI
jgi:hypothetical protein